MRYVLVGAQGSGKSSVLHHFDTKMNIITEVVRNLAKDEQIPVNEQGSFHGQTRIFDTYLDVLSRTETPFISDRGLVDVIAYTAYNMKDKGEEGEEFLTKQIDKLVEWSQKYPDTVYFYVPIEFPVVYDGFRSMDEDFRTEIDNNIHEILEGMGVDYVTLHGSIEERVAQVEEVMRQHGDLK